MKKPIEIEYDGQVFPSRKELARHLVRATGRTFQACNAALRRRGDDAAAVIEFYRRARRQRDVTGRPRRPVATIKSGKVLHYDGQTFPDRTALASHLAPIVGQSIDRCWALLRNMNDDGAAVVASIKPGKVLHYEGHVFPSRSHLARYLAVLTKLSESTCQKLLRRYGDDGDQVIEYHRQQTERIVISSRAYRSARAFLRSVSTRFRINIRTISRWHYENKIPLDRIEAHARAFNAKHGKGPGHYEKSGEIVIFGWRFSSLTAAQSYYRATASEASFAVWREHLGGDYELFLPALARLWETGRLDERNRYSVEVEARMPRRQLPLNAVMLEVTDPVERSYIDALQPDDPNTMRRHALRKLESWRQRAGTVAA